MPPGIVGNADVDVVLLRHVLLLGASLTVIVAGCVLVGSTHGCGRMHCNHQELPLQVQSCAFIATATQFGIVWQHIVLRLVLPLGS